MKKIISVTVTVVIGIFLIVVGWEIYKFNFTNDDIYIATSDTLDSKDGTYLIEGEAVTLKDGYYEKVTLPGGSSKEVTRYFGNDVKADFNNDGVIDEAFLLTRDNGGSGIFYYMAARVSEGNKFISTNVLFVGDRIAPQSTDFMDGIIIVNYADRKLGESFATPSSVGISKYYKIINNKLTEVANQ